ncbi:MAG TPA: TIGR00153 family protein [Chlamydiales bacterium]|nr:TIGR00153 family protein [Chlamydiales bacterium]
MLSIAKLFGKSPFAPLQTHIDKVAACVDELPALFQALVAQDMDAIQRIGLTISRLEHEADLTKNDIRNHLPKSLFLPVDRGAILEILSLQDALADQAEEIAQHAAMRKLILLPEMAEEFAAFCMKNLEAFWLARQVIKELEELIESSFGGIEAQKVKGMVEQIAYTEYEMDQIRTRLMTRLYQTGDGIPYPAFHLCHTLIEEIGCLAYLSEKLGNRVRMLLELK